MNQPGIDTRMMDVALMMGRRGLGEVWPNPAVGCVIAQGSRIIARGRTQKTGRPHAEVDALARAGTAARGATAYVTLEPCSHHGKTGPCADALVAAGVARVVVATPDPNPQVNGAGIARLRAAGIDVTVGVGEETARCDNAGFLCVVERGRPFVTLKLASSLDGRIATASGESKWITGPDARSHVHAMRATHDGILVGGGTARADDPDLTVRGQGPGRDRVRIVATRGLNLPLDGRLAQTAGEKPLWLMHGPGADIAPWNAIGAQTHGVDLGADRRIDPNQMMQKLAQAGMTRVFCEGGGGLAASLLGAGLVDRIVIYHAGLAIGAEGTPSIGPMGIGALSMAPRFDLVDIDRVGHDTVSTWEPRASAG